MFSESSVLSGFDFVLLRASVSPKKQNGGLLETKDFLAARPNLHFVSSPTRLGRAQSVALW